MPLTYKREEKERKERRGEKDLPFKTLLLRNCDNVSN